MKLNMAYWDSKGLIRAQYGSLGSKRAHWGSTGIFFLVEKIAGTQKGSRFNLNL